MDIEKILNVIEGYREGVLAGVVAKRMNPELAFGSMNNRQLLWHAAYLCDNVETFIYLSDRTSEYDLSKIGKLNRHLASIQMILSFCGYYSLQQLMDHNRP